MRKPDIKHLIFLTGVGGPYHLHTGGFAGLDCEIVVDRASVGFALQRALRAEAEKHPELFPYQPGELETAIENAAPTSVPWFERNPQEDDVSESDEEPTKLRNFYKCDRCSYEWEDIWSCSCDDDCPNCGLRHMTPYRSEDV